MNNFQFWPHGVILAVVLFLLGALALWLFRKPDSGSGVSNPDSDSDDSGSDIIPTSSEERIYNCFHSGPQTFRFRLFGEESKEIDDPELCPDCVLAKLHECVIRCAVCGGAIFPGNGVAVYHVMNNKMLNLEIATYADKDHVIGCLGMDCCPSGGFFAGHWDGKSFQSEYGGTKTAVEQVFDSGDMIVTSIGK